MRPQIVVEGNPVADDSAGMLDGFKAVAMHALLFDRPDQPFDHTVLLRAMRGNEFLLQAVALHQCGVAARGEHQPVIGPKQEWAVNLAQGAIPGNQSLLQGGFCSASPARAG